MDDVTREIVSQKIETMKYLGSLCRTCAESLENALARELHPDLELEFEDGTDTCSCDNNCTDCHCSDTD